MMNAMNPLMIIGALSMLTLLTALILQGRRSRRLQQQLDALGTASEESRVVEPHESFSLDLVQAEKRMEQPHPHQPEEVPERYRYIRAMARQGLPADQIATTMQIGEAEADQIVRLVRLSQVG